MTTTNSTIVWYLLYISYYIYIFTRRPTQQHPDPWQNRNHKNMWQHVGNFIAATKISREVNIHLKINICLRCYTVHDQSLGNHRRHSLSKTSLHSTGTIDLELLIMIRIQRAWSPACIFNASLCKCLLHVRHNSETGCTDETCQLLGSDTCQQGAPLPQALLQEEQLYAGTHHCHINGVPCVSWDWTQVWPWRMPAMNSQGVRCWHASRPHLEHGGNGGNGCNGRNGCKCKRSMAMTHASKELLRSSLLARLITAPWSRKYATNATDANAKMSGSDTCQQGAP